MTSYGFGIIRFVIKFIRFARSRGKAAFCFLFLFIVIYGYTINVVGMSAREMVYRSDLEINREIEEKVTRSGITAGTRTSACVSK